MHSVKASQDICCLECTGLSFCKMVVFQNILVNLSSCKVHKSSLTGMLGMMILKLCHVWEMPYVPIS